MSEDEKNPFSTNGKRKKRPGSSEDGNESRSEQPEFRSQINRGSKSQKPQIRSQIPQYRSQIPRNQDQPSDDKNADN